MSGKKRALRSSGRVLLLAVISLLIGTRLYAWNARVVAGNALPMPFGWGVSVVLSGSMEPTLSVNDLVVIRAQDAYAVGDIVVYQRGNMLVLHRIISLAGGEAVTQGDANNAADSPIDPADIRGKAVARVPGAGAAVNFIKTPAGTVLFLAAAIVLFELPHLRKRRAAEAEKERLRKEIRRLKGE